MSSRCLSTVAATAVLSFAPCLHGQLVFTPLGDLAGGDTLSYGNTVSADGIVVAGLASDAGGNRASIWNGGWQTLGDFAGGENYSEAFAISADGGVVVGQSHGTTGYKSFRWTQAGGFQSLGDLASTGLDSEARGVSANGSVIVGAYNERTNPGGGGILADAYRWTQAGGLQDLGDLPGSYGFSLAQAVSADGTIVAGYGSSTLGTQSFIWTEAGGMVGLGDLAGGAYYSVTGGISDDGSTVVGASYIATGYVAYRWTEETGMVALSDLPGGDVASFAYDASADGSIVVGWGTGTGGTTSALFWDAEGQMHDLNSIVSGNPVYSGWTLTHAYGVSADGDTIVGRGFNPDGFIEAFRITGVHAYLATVPEPSEVAVLAGLATLAAVALQRRRKGLDTA